MPGGEGNPLGARALYLYKDSRDTNYRLHGTLEPWTIGTKVSSGCIRLLNQDVIDLYRRVPLGAKVIVLRATASPDDEARPELQMQPEDNGAPAWDGPYDPNYFYNPQYY
jgi:hypothetical protein